MSSPLGHGLTGAALLIAGAPRPSAANAAPLLALALAGAAIANLPDLDFLPAVLGLAPRELVHRSATHSLAAALLAALLAGPSLGAWLGSGAGRGRLLAGTIWASHLLLDLLAPDSRPPAGLQLLWPLDRTWIAPLPLLPEVDVSRLLEGRSDGLARGLLLELALAGPLLVLASWRWLRARPEPRPSAPRRDSLE